MKVYALLVHADITYNFEEIEKEKIKSHLFQLFQEHLHGTDCNTDRSHSMAVKEAN